LRVQLRRALAKLSLVATILAIASGVQADVGSVDAYTTLFYEYGGPLNMLVVTPRADARVDPIEQMTIRATWEADVVSGASVAVVDAPSPEPDVITSATQITDFRNVFGGSMELRGQFGSIRGGYNYGFENDYRSHSFNLGARAELFERNTTFDLSYARGFDSVCDVNQPRAQEAVQRNRLDAAIGCFSNAMNRTTHDIAIHSFQAAWTQAWASVFTTQLTITGQLIEGFQSNPYRAVWLGRTAAQEHHPDVRFRYASGLSARLWIEPTHGAVQANVRVYRDTWDVRSITAELAYEQAIGSDFRMRVRGRYYRQGGAAFFSDDYATAPRGQYFTGDRELSDMESYMLGGQITWTIAAGSEGASLGPFTTFHLILKGDWIHYNFTRFRYGRAGVPNVDAVVGTLGLELGF
jgi:hypothetical protein